ncbi:hypothetical protein CLU79DRAFT_764620 [Phycomyces nitens]|nr:hypothetical protein CLU79DRAFT_764620 [Phycomyces nitens]
MPSGKIQAPTLCFGDISREEINTLLGEAGVSLTAPQKTPFATGVRRKTPLRKQKQVIVEPLAVAPRPIAPAKKEDQALAPKSVQSPPIQTNARTSPAQNTTPVATAVSTPPTPTPTPTPASAPAPTAQPTTPAQSGPAPVKPKPVSSWASLVKSNVPVKPVSPAPENTPIQKVTKPVTVGPAVPKFTGIADIINTYTPTYEGPLLQPRGLINNVNTCFMNVILQPLSHCPPFYNLIKSISQHVIHTFKSKTPLLDSLIEFINEFLPERADRVEEQFGKPFVPEYVYDALRGQKRFDSLRGRQEDAEEFLCFLLDGLHEEMVAVLKDQNDKRSQEAAANGTQDVWLEVGPKNKTSSLRSAGFQESPISKIFGGKVRSVLRCPGAKDSVNLEPYQSLPLDIQPANVNTIQDAIRNMTLPETMHDYMSPKGVCVDATKQIYLENIPPVLILHMKRFVFDNVGGVQKLQKQVTYGTTLTIDPEWMAQSSKSSSPINYHLFGVVYHHGVSAGGGHYTCDIKRRNGEWLHIDDTTITPISEQQVLVTENTRTESIHTDQTAYILFYMRA